MWPTGKGRNNILLCLYAAFLGLLLVNAAPAQLCELTWFDDLLASDSALREGFGSDVDASGEYIVVGKPGDSENGFQSGAAYVFLRVRNGTIDEVSDDAWIEVDKLTPSDGAASDLFGQAVAISGDWVLVGAREDDDAGSRSGSAYVFRRHDSGTPGVPEDDQWTEIQKLTAADAEAGDEFGLSVAMNSAWAVIGAFRDDDACPADPNCNSGAAYVFRRWDNNTPTDSSDDTWIQHAKLTAPDADPVDLFGQSVAIDGDRIIVGRHLGDGIAASAGNAYVFRCDDGGTPGNLEDDMWLQEDILAASDGAFVDLFGFSVDISGKWAVVGAHFDDDLGNKSGSAYVFRLDDNDTPANPSDDFWIEEQKILADDGEDGDEFGFAVGINGGRIIIGAPFERHETGRAYLYVLDENETPSNASDDQWRPTGSLRQLAPNTGEEFGRSVAMSTDMAVIGAPENASRGSASVFLVDGVFFDNDEDGVPNECDVCDGGDDELDTDGDGVADFCDPCPLDDPDDTDADGVCDANDICPGFDDAIDDDGDGVPNACEACPNDPNKIEPGICGCGKDDIADSDGDSVPDCDDECPGADDSIFAPECDGAVPTVSAWGLVVMTILLLAGIKLIRLGERKSN